MSLVYSRKELAARYLTDVRTIDRWRQLKWLPTPRRTPAGRPFWTENQIQFAENCSVRRVTKNTAKATRRAAWLAKRKSFGTSPKVRQINLPQQLNLLFK